MQYILIAGILITFCSAGFGVRPVASHYMPAVTATQHSTAFFSTRYMSRNEIQENLVEIAKKPASSNLATGAKSQKVTELPERIRYDCPTCGGTVFYGMPEDSTEPNFIQVYVRKTITLIACDLEKIRQLSRQIKKLDISLDESGLCPRCRPEGIPHSIGLVINYPNRPVPHRAWDITCEDMLMIKAVTEGRRTYKNQQNWQVPLKDNLPRLEELLGAEAIPPKDLYLSRKEVKDLLYTIARKPIPKITPTEPNPKPGPSESPNFEVIVDPGSPMSVNYFCPACEKLTVYGRPDVITIPEIPLRNLNDLSGVIEIDPCRQIVQTIGKLDIMLDESEFCRCSGSYSKSPTLRLTVIYWDRKRPHKASAITLSELKMIKAVTEGQLTYVDADNVERPLRKEMIRLKELLSWDWNDRP